MSTDLNNKIENLDKYSLYKDLSEIFVGLGVLLIDGYALVSNLVSNYEHFDLSMLVNEVDLFIKKLKNCDFKQIQIVLFKDYYCVHNAKSDETIENIFRTIFKDEQYILFENCEDVQWSEYLLNEKICLIIASSDTKLNENMSKFNRLTSFNHINSIGLIGYILKNTDLAVCSMETLSFQESKLFGFLIETEISDVYKTSSESIHDSDMMMNKFNLYEILNKDLIRILNVTHQNNSKTKDDDGNTRNLINEEEIWNIHCKNDDDEWDDSAKGKKKKLKQHQKYYRHMEKYSNSLDSSKNLHHKILSCVKIDTNEKSSEKQTYKQQKGGKLSKAEEIIRENEKRIEKKKEENDLNMIKHLQSAIQNLNFKDKVDHIDNYINEYKMSISSANYSKMFPFNLARFKIEIFLNEFKYGTKSEQLLANIICLLKEFIEVQKENIIQNKNVLIGVISDLKLIAQHGFIEFSKYFVKYLELDRNEKLLQDIICFNLPKFDMISFDKEIIMQLKYNGDKLKRTLNSKYDSRVRFEPDEWQRRLLDVVDDNESALVCCPTSSGKTFICYYAMDKILRSGNYNDKIVFISPTKALANQVAAEIYARFGDHKYPTNVNKTVYSMYMMDYKINDINNSQIIIAESQSFENLVCACLTNTNTNEFQLDTVKYLIIDEVQTINNDNGPSIEKIIHFIQCPIIALSATIANFDCFYNWFESIEKFKGKQKLHAITNNERYCDLEKYLYVPREVIEETSDLDSLIRVNEMFAYSKGYLKKYDYSADFHLLPTELVEILQILHLITKDNPQQASLIESVQPNKFFKSVAITKNQVKEYEKFLMEKFRQWIVNDVLTEEQIEQFYELLNGKCNKAYFKMKLKYGDFYTQSSWAVENIYDLVKSLKERNMLPAIIFAGSCNLCDELAIKLVKELEREENMDENNNINVKRQEKRNEKLQKERNKTLKSFKNADSESSWQEIARINEEIASNIVDTSKIDDKYTFLNPKYKLTSEEINEEIELHKDRLIPKELFDGLKRGIGVHHANFHTKYRATTEYLFRKRHLQVVFATETLSLGINMPCKTVVLTKDSKYYDSLLYRQMIGRAGRRGFDTIGHVVYYGLSKEHVQNFISSFLINIKGSFKLDFKNLLQLSVLQAYKKENINYLESMIKYPISKFNNALNFDEKSHLNTIRMQVNFLIENNYLNTMFEPLINTNLIIPLRQVDCCEFLLSQIVSQKVLQKMISPHPEQIDVNCDTVVKILCHFIHVSYINPSIVSSIPAEAKLESCNELESFLTQYNGDLRAYINEMTTFSGESSPSNIRNLFSYYLNLPKNSYIYNFYIRGSIDYVEKTNRLSVTKLWYALKSFIIVLDTIIRFLSFEDNKQIYEPHLIKTLLKCQSKINERFESIKN